MSVQTCLTIVATCLALVGAGCGDSGSGSSVSTPPGKTEVDDSSTPEAQLVSIDETSLIVDEQTVRRYGFLLDRLEELCSDRPRRLSDLSVRATELLDKNKGVDVSNKDVLTAVIRGVPSGPCVDDFAAYVTATGEP